MWQISLKVDYLPSPLLRRASTTKCRGRNKGGYNVLLKKAAHIGLARRLLGSLANRITLVSLSTTAAPAPRLRLPSMYIASSCHNSSRCFEEHTQCPVPNWPFKSPSSHGMIAFCGTADGAAMSTPALVVFIARCTRAQLHNHTLICICVRARTLSFTFPLSQCSSS